MIYRADDYFCDETPLLWRDDACEFCGRYIGHDRHCSYFRDISTDSPQDVEDAYDGPYEA